MPVPALREVHAGRYLTPLREGGSLPAICEADDLGTYVVKFRGAGQGVKALIAEIITAQLARVAGFNVPELVLVQLDPALPGSEPDPEIQDLLRASAGRNLGVDFLPRSFQFDPAVDPVDPQIAARLVWFDALVSNVDRSWRNPNLLSWHRQLWLIDHGAALTFAHRWSSAAGAPDRPYAQVGEHVMLPSAGSILEAHAALAPLFPRAVLQAATAPVPDDWLADDADLGPPDAVRTAYVDVLAARMERRDAWVPALEAARARL